MAETVGHGIIMKLKNKDSLYGCFLFGKISYGIHGNNGNVA